MSTRVCDYRIHEFDVEYDYTYYQRDSDGDAIEPPVTVHKTDTVRVLAERFKTSAAEGAVHDRFRHVAVEGSLKILDRRQVEIDAMLLQP
jgi:hypothetical protein